MNIINAGLELKGPKKGHNQGGDERADMDQLDFNAINSPLHASSFGDMEEDETLG